MAKRLGDYLIKAGLIMPEQLQHAIEVQKERNEQLGKVLVDLGYLTLGQMSETLVQQMKPQAIQQRKRIGDVLIELGVITNDQLAHALQKQKITKKRIGQTLVELGYVTKDQITKSLSEKLKIPIISCADYLLSDELKQLIPKNTALKNLILPIEKRDKDGVLILAMADPLDYKIIDELSFKTKLKISQVISYEWSILKAIEQNYVEDESVLDVYTADISEDKEIKFSESVNSSDEEMDSGALMKALETKSKLPPIVKLVAKTITDAVKAKTSDIHVEPRDRYVQVRFRIDGELHNIFKYDKSAHDAMVSRIKVLSSLDITNRRLPQDGSFHVSFQDKGVDLRVSTLPSIYGEKIVIRLLDEGFGMIPLEDLAIPDRILSSIIEVFKRPQGMLIVTGPTGSGKTTTLYACINQLRSDTRNIVTIEDPVEYKLEGITQISVNERIGRTFVSILRSVLRQDPDVIKIGEIRDFETAEISIKAALTGHLVLTTLHTNNTVATITRLINIGIPSYLLSSAISGILAQRLVRRICNHCKVEADVIDSASSDFLRTLNSYGLPEVKRHYYGKGCPKCYNTGYSGRVAVYEYLHMTPVLRRLISNDVSEEKLLTTARGEGITFLIDDALDKVRKGITSLEEVMAKVPIEYMTGSRIQ